TAACGLRGFPSDSAPTLVLRRRELSHDRTRGHERNDARDAELRHRRDDLLGPLATQDRDGEREADTWLRRCRPALDDPALHLMRVDGLERDDRLDSVAHQRDTPAGTKPQHVGNLMRLIAPQDRTLQ